MNKNINLSDNLKELSEIANWFDLQETVDVEVGLEKVKRAAVLIKESKSRLRAIENEFNEIKKDIDDDQSEESSYLESSLNKSEEDLNTGNSDTIKPEDVPF